MKDWYEDYRDLRRDISRIDPSLYRENNKIVENRCTNCKYNTDCYGQCEEEHDKENC